MKKTKFFWKSLLPFLFLFIMQFVAAIPVAIFFCVRSIQNTGDLSGIIQLAEGLTTNQEFTQLSSCAYGVLSLIIFGIWYRKVFVKPYQERRRHYPGGFSFHTIVSLLFLAVGLQYVTSLLVQGLSLVRPDLVAQYSTDMSSRGYDNISMILLIYTILLAPIVEELVFRGLIFRYARHVMPFWLANIWQALLFGIVHLNPVQSLYAFVLGLFLGWICHRGHGIRYSIPLHIAFNILGSLFSELISMSLALSFPLFSALGIVLTVFALWLFYTDFQTDAPRTRE